MKKLTVMTIVLTILLALTTIVNAQEPAPTEAPAEEPKEVTVPFDLGKTPVRAGTYTVSYDKDYLEFKEAEPCDAANPDDVPGEVKITFSGKNTTKITVTFTVKKAIDKDLAVTLKAEGFKTTTGETITGEEIGELKGTVKPTTTPTPTPTPTVEPSEEPTKAPTVEPTEPAEPTGEPTTPAEPTGEPTVEPTRPDGTYDPSEGPAEPAEENNNSDVEDTEMLDKTGVSIAYVGVVALIVLVGTVVLIKRK